MMVHELGHGVEGCPRPCGGMAGSPDPCPLEEVVEGVPDFLARLLLPSAGSG